MTATEVARCSTSSIVFTRILPSQYQVWMADQSGANAKQLSAGPADNWPTCTPDGRWVVYLSITLGEKYRRFMKISAAGGQPAELARVDAVTYEPRISPDGRSLSYIRYF